ncbi:MAG: alpha/beta hydrolase fold domain-containing protein, partial [Pseudomonadota bacterium]
MTAQTESIALAPDGLAARFLAPEMAAILAAHAAPPTDQIDEMRANALASKAVFNERAKANLAVRAIEVPGADGVLTGLCVGETPGKVPVVHIHGGGWAAGSPSTHLSLLAGLHRATGRTVFAPHPRQAPEHPFPAPLRDTVAAIRSLARGASAPIHLSGDSAGAHLALAAVLAARDDGAPLPLASLTLMYGCYRKRFDTTSHTTFGDGTAGLSTERMRLFWEWFSPDGAAD